MESILSARPFDQLVLFFLTRALHSSMSSDLKQCTTSSQISAVWILNECMYEWMHVIMQLFQFPGVWVPIVWHLRDPRAWPHWEPCSPRWRKSPRAPGWASPDKARWNRRPFAAMLDRYVRLPLCHGKDGLDVHVPLSVSSNPFEQMSMVSRRTGMQSPSTPWFWTDLISSLRKQKSHSSVDSSTTVCIYCHIKSWIGK